MSRRRRPGSIRGERGRAIRLGLAERDGARCFYCCRPLDPILEGTLDHYVPYSVWRSNRPWNLVLACGPCNNAKADRLPWTLALLLLRQACPAAA